MCCACRVSNELGAGNPKTARHTTNVGLFLTLTTTTCLNVPIFFFRYTTALLLPPVITPHLAVSFGARVHLLLLLLSPCLSSSLGNGSWYISIVDVQWQAYAQLKYCT